MTSSLLLLPWQLVAVSSPEVFEVFSTGLPFVHHCDDKEDFSLSSCAPKLGNVYTAGSLAPFPPPSSSCHCITLFICQGFDLLFLQLNLPNPWFHSMGLPQVFIFPHALFPRGIPADAVKVSVAMYFVNMSMKLSVNNTIYEVFVVWIDRLQTAWQCGRRGGYMTSPMCWKV